MTTAAVPLPAPPASQSAQRAFLVDLLLSTVVPLACYKLARGFFSASEMQGLVLSTIYPIAASLRGLAAKRQVNVSSAVVLLGIAASLVAMFLGGSPRLLLLRESMVTLALGLACFATLPFPRPLMFFFGRQMVAGGDPIKIAAFNRRAAEPAARGTHRRITAVWGAALTLEFCCKAALVFALPTAQVLALSPFLFNGAMLLTMLWTVRYAKARRTALAVKEDRMQSA